MSLNALNTSTAGLQVTQAAIGLVSQNVANAGTAGYVKRSLTSVSTLGNSGVATGTISRTLDAVSLKQLRLETAGSGLYRAVGQGRCRASSTRSTAIRAAAAPSTG